MAQHIVQATTVTQLDNTKKRLLLVLEICLCCGRILITRYQKKKCPLYLKKKTSRSPINILVFYFMLWDVFYSQEIRKMNLQKNL